jgi:hypothetical protein
MSRTARDSSDGVKQLPLFVDTNMSTPASHYRTTIITDNETEWYKVPSSSSFHGLGLVACSRFRINLKLWILHSWWGSLDGASAPCKAAAYTGQHRNRKFWEELIACFILYDTDRIENDVSNNSSIVVCVFVAAVTFTEQLPSNDRWIHI